MGENSFAEGYAIGRDSNNSYGYGGFGNDWWGLIALALVFGWGGNGFGGFGGRGYGAGGSELLGYELGKVATTNDVASGFNNSAVLGSLNDIKLGQASMQNWINQGFAGLNTQLLTGFHGVDNAICTLGYQNQMGFNGISREISDCCCTTQRAIDGINYNIAKQTCDIITNANANTQRIIDMYTSDKIETLNRKLATAESRINAFESNQYLLSELKPCAKPAYITCSPYQSVFGYNNNGCCNGGF